MSNEAQGLVRNLDLDAPTKPILMAYASYADEAGYCFPGVETIAWDTGYSVPTVVRVRRELVAGNWLRSKRRFGTSAGTRLNLVKMAAEAVDRGDRTKIKPEFEFEEETAGHAQSDQADLNVSDADSRSDQRDLNDQIREICTTDQADHLSISYPSVDPSVEERTDGRTLDPEDWALRLIADLDYGRHRRPSRKQAAELARLVEAAHAGGLTPVEIRRHARATLNAAVRSGVSYLRGGLQPERLPMPKPAGHSEQQRSANDDTVTSDNLSADDLLSRGLPEAFLPSRFRTGTTGG